MKLRPLQFLGITLLAALQSDCIPSCPENPCEESFDPLRWCVTSDTCRLNGQWVSSCSDCTTWNIKTLEIPFDEVWPLLGNRNDMLIRWDKFFGESTVELVLDGVPATEDQCKRAPFAQFFEMTCLNLPRSMKRLEIKYTPPPGSDGVEVEAFIVDEECEAAHPTCPV